MGIPPDWPLDVPCRMAFIGEAPADEEVNAEIPRPLIGPAGRLFNKLCRIALVERSEHLITNVFDTQLPGNEVANWCGTTKEAKEWRKDGYMLPAIHPGKWLRPEYVYHLDRLWDELRRAQPTVVVPLGGTALWALNGVSSIMAHRGTTSLAKMTRQPYKVVPTLHPSFLFHSWKWLHTVAADIMKADRESYFPEIRMQNRELWVDPSLDDIAEFTEKYLSNPASGMVALDIETIPAWRHITAISFAGDPDHAICIPFVDWRKTDRSYWPTVEQELAAIARVRLLCESSQPKILQNGPYDIQWLWWTWGIRVQNYLHDTRLMHHGLFPELPKSLAVLGSRYADLGAWKVMRTSKTEKVDD